MPESSREPIHTTRPIKTGKSVKQLQIMSICFLENMSSNDFMVALQSRSRYSNLKNPSHSQVSPIYLTFQTQVHLYVIYQKAHWIVKVCSDTFTPIFEHISIIYKQQQLKTMVLKETSLWGRAYQEVGWSFINFSHLISNLSRNHLCQSMLLGLVNIVILISESGSFIHICSQLNISFSNHD